MSLSAILRACDWQGAPFGKLQASPRTQSRSPVGQTEKRPGMMSRKISRMWSRRSEREKVKEAGMSYKSEFYDLRMQPKTFLQKFDSPLPAFLLNRCLARCQELSM